MMQTPPTTANAAAFRPTVRVTAALDAKGRTEGTLSTGTNGVHANDGRHYPDVRSLHRSRQGDPTAAGDRGHHRVPVVLHRARDAGGRAPVGDVSVDSPRVGCSRGESQPRLWCHLPDRQRAHRTAAVPGCPRSLSPSGGAAHWRRAIYRVSGARCPIRVRDWRATDVPGRSAFGISATSSTTSTSRSPEDTG
jgi:hypothetical protein